MLMDAVMVYPMHDPIRFANWASPHKLYCLPPGPKQEKHYLIQKHVNVYNF